MFVESRPDVDRSELNSVQTVRVVRSSDELKRWFIIDQAGSMCQKVTQTPHGEDGSTGCVAQLLTQLFDRESGTVHTREQVVA